MKRKNYKEIDLKKERGNESNASERERERGNETRRDIERGIDRVPLLKSISVLFLAKEKETKIRQRRR